MNPSDIIANIGVVGMLGGFMYVGRKLQVLDDLKIDSTKLKTNFKVMSDFLIRNNSDFNSSELEAFSPVQLTEKGNKFIKENGFDIIFRDHKSDFFDCITSENPKLKYDVEIASIRSISVLSEKDYMKFLKILFYNEPSRKIENTAPILGIYLRDRYLEEHPEITQ